ncbi:CDP-diacylglycerol--serine O-phosphatidyltransferase [Methylobacterium sp. Leaf469]|uniref:CDP-diacylglycerol--serine O-phosphatidyltransferase n=1 Tax=unclassified Methylobacterium TaxID=2615210 RepID=UPI0006FCF5DD|nr:MULTISPECIES: CDP-diacylglycerol--serine O-phosphatidyltransferase [unclassified Methylobacterium]KQO59332.1 CDP-diacylglycerol--serine O-phosphatidyltransferase [Methylobacterium sp. Leaf87]KQP34850.1 CDP-diacylglycerol--serine O-phosphatidyltransferase [Methylobacterium sp. Leaf100]KQP58455.1 CDP-diacylglycerol--serine O-phosphatidyltransferase [Methylobacterium sp. Leaf112]KQT89917.1 CDP-diacylglycerol--serine O-phosphatidyltransferase [Methylobacterium sp. Leaf469]
MDDLFPPFAPDANEPRPRRFKPVPFRMIAPNMITLMALCLGLTAIRLAFEGKFEPAVIAIVAAAFLDGIDGRVARMLKGTSRFGAELDSLADFVNFGCAPALILYGFALKELKSVGWIVALIFAIAMALRLARFNAMLDDPNRPAWKKDFFVGMPAPAGALTVLLPLYLHFLGLPLERWAAPVVLGYMLCIALLVVSTVPTFSGKTVGKRVPREAVLPIFLVGVAAFGLLISFPFEAMVALALGYLVTLPIGAAQYRRRAKAEARAAASLPAPAPDDRDPGGSERDRAVDS